MAKSVVDELSVGKKKSPVRSKQPTGMLILNFASPLGGKSKGSGKRQGALKKNESSTKKTNEISASQTSGVEAVKRKTMRAAKSAIAAGNPKALSVRKLCSESGVTNGSFFHAFESKSNFDTEVYLDIIRQYRGRLLAHIKSGNAVDAACEFAMAPFDILPMNRKVARYMLEVPATLDKKGLKALNSEKLIFEKMVVAKFSQKGVTLGVPVSMFLLLMLAPVERLCFDWCISSGSSPLKAPSDLMPSIRLIAESIVK